MNDKRPVAVAGAVLVTAMLANACETAVPVNAGGASSVSTGTQSGATTTGSTASVTTATTSANTSSSSSSTGAGFCVLDTSATLDSCTLK